MQRKAETVGQHNGRVLTRSEAIHRLAYANNLRGLQSSAERSQRALHNSTSTNTARSTRLRWSSSSCRMCQNSDAEGMLDSAQHAAADRAHVARRPLMLNLAGHNSHYVRDPKAQEIPDDLIMVCVSIGS